MIKTMVMKVMMMRRKRRRRRIIIYTCRNLKYANFFGGFRIPIQFSYLFDVTTNVTVIATYTLTQMKDSDSMLIKDKPWKAKDSRALLRRI